jgi:hypothetical protein
LDPEYEASSGMPVAVTPIGEIILATSVTDKSAERDRLDKEIARIEAELKMLGTPRCGVRSTCMAAASAPRLAATVL